MVDAPGWLPSVSCSATRAQLVFSAESISLAMANASTQM